MKKTPVDLQQRFQIFHAYPKCLAAYLCGSASLQDQDKVEKTMVDWERGVVRCVLIQHLENLSNLHTIDFILQFLYLASEFMDSISILDQFSSRNCVEC